MTFEIPASVSQVFHCDVHGDHEGRWCPDCLDADGQTSLFAEPAPDPVGQEGVRGGTVHDFDEAETRLEESSAEELATVKGRIVQMAARYGDVHADYVRDGVTNPQVIGAAFAQLVSEGVIKEAGRRKSQVKSTHGRKSGVYRLTDDGRFMAQALGYEPKAA